MNSQKETRTKIDEEGNEIVKLQKLEHGDPDIPVQTPKEDVEPKPKKSANIFNFLLSHLTSFFSSFMQMKIEVILFLYMFSTMVKRISITTMIIDKVCQVHLNHSQEICQDLSNHTDIKIQVERIANNYSLAHFMMDMIPVSILACFIGAWSDKYGRKIPIVVALIGAVAEEVGSVICAAFFNSRIEFFLITPLVAGCTGGFTGLLTVLYSYASDITTSAKRTTKYAIMEAAIGLSIPMGQFTGGALFKCSGYTSVFIVSAVAHALSLLWAILVLKETRGLDCTDSWIVKLKSFWSLRSVIDSFKVTAAKRPNRGRDKILLLMLSRGIIIIIYTAMGSVLVMYVHNLYDWGNEEISIVSAIFSFIGTVTMVISVLVLKKLKIRDAILGLIGVSSLFLNSIATGIASKKEIFYIGQVIGLLGGLCTLACRSGISKVPSKDDLGKVFSFLTILESILPMIAVAIATQVFNVTVHVYQGIIFLSVSVFLLIPAGIFIWLARLPSVNDEEENSNSENKEDIEIKDSNIVYEEQTIKS